MTTGTRLSITILSLWACLSLSGASRAAAAAAGPGKRLEAHSVDPLARLRARLPRSRVERPRDLVLVEGREITSIQGPAPIEELRMMAFRPGEDWVVIPFQIDERDAEGAWIWPDRSGGKGAPAEGEGVLTPEDELVFRPRDLGPRAARTAWPEGVHGGVEIEVHDPLTGGRGWAYLFRFDAPPPLAVIDQVRAYAGSGGPGDSIVTPYYRVFYPRRRGRFVPGVMTELAIDGSGRERYGPNLLDREKLRYTGRDRFFPGVGFRRNEDGIEARRLAVIDGPLRAIRKVERRVRLRGWFDGKVRSTAVFLPDRIILDEPDGAPGAMRFLVRDIRARFYWDFQPLPGSRIFAAPVPGGAPPEILERPAGRRLDGAPSAWWALATRDHGALLAVYRPPGRAAARPAPALVFRSTSAPDPPETAPGGHPAVGWRVAPAEEARAGGATAQVHLFVLESFTHGTQRAVLDRLRAPLRVKAGPGLAR